MFLFLRSARATLIPSVAVPVSLIGTFGIMYLCHYSIDNLSLMALTISTGFVVDDAIVVIENVTRYLEQGMSPMEAALKGAREVGFTVLTISISLVAVFIPILLMGGIVGRLFREFAVTLSVAIMVSLAVSLTTTPMMCSRLLKHRRDRRTTDASIGPARGSSPGCWAFMSAAWPGCCAIRPSRWASCSLTVALNVFLFIKVPKGFFPAAGQRDGFRRHPGRAGRLLPGHADGCRPLCQPDQNRPRRGQRHGLYRRGRRRQQRFRLCRIEAA